MSSLPLTNNGRACFTLEVTFAPGDVARNALALFDDECRERYGVSPTAVDAARIVIRLTAPTPQAGNDDQTFKIRTTQEGKRTVVTVTGTGERGLLYGICELLDELQSVDGVPTLPALNLRSTPAIPQRGVERHWLPSLTTRAGVEENRQLIRALARRRVNTLLWIDGWISPGWYRFLTFRHFAPLLQEDGDGAIAEAKACVNDIIAEARSWGMAFYLSGTEFNFPAVLLERAPELFTAGDSGYPVLNLDQPGTWAFYQAKIREVMEDFPGLAGIELWTAEALDISYCYSARGEEWTIPQRLHFLYDQTLAAMDRAGHPDARIIAATFIHHPLGERVFDDLCGQLPARVDARMKMQVEDFYRFNDPTTLAGRIAPGREWVEFDTGGEHRGDWAGWITAALDFIPERMRLYHARGVTNFIDRVRGYSKGPGSHCVGDLDALTGVEAFKHEIYFALCWDLSQSLETIWRRTNKGRYPDAMLDFFRLSERVAENAQYINRCLINNNHASFLGSVEHYEYRFKNCDVVNNTACKARAWILEPTPENLALILQEKAQAIEDVLTMQRILDECRASIAAEDYTVLKSTLDYQAQSVRVFKAHVELFFRYRLFLHTKAPDRFANLVASMARLEEAIVLLRAYDPVQADAAHALLTNIRSLTWVKICGAFLAPKGMVQ
jgi:hypothetical protein